MKLLRMYYLEDHGLTAEQCVKIKESLNLDHIIQVKANNKLEHTQYPVFEFEEVEFETVSKGFSVEVTDSDIKKASDNIRRFCERNTSI